MIELIVNPVAGNGLAKQIGEEAAAYLTEKGVPFTVSLTEHPGHATELAQAAAERGVDTVIALGGDGTVCETAAGLVHTQTALGIAPAGTGNDFIKTVGTPRDWKKALDFILSHPARPVNTGTVNDRFFLNVCGGGFDVLVLTYALEAKKHCKGIWPYLYGVLRAIKTFRPFEMHLEAGDQAFDGSYMICSIANGRYIGGGIPIAMMADVTDGLLDVVAVDAVPRWQIPFYLPSLMMGTLYKKKIAHHYRAKTCALSSPNMLLNLDGEILPIPSSRYTCECDALLLHW
ncbi:MAG: diacylglycerol kinase family lipid kinase [Eubacteriales bacterium]|nr:diacylglycerol kinase family lipid kinase [Eubacteriales bacterium]